jgi:hypothetical protein
MNEKQSLALAERVQKKIQEENPLFRLMKRRDEIEKEFKVENENQRS